jgi:hypothetical protein
MPEAGFTTEIAKGLRVRLAAQGLTGTAYLEADPRSRAQLALNRLAAARLRRPPRAGSRS